jgi:hypothetical protein
MTNRLINKALFYNEWFLATHEPPHNKKQEKTRLPATNSQTGFRRHK